MDRIQTPGKQDPGRQEPLELPGRNSSTYGDGDIPEIDLPGADNATPVSYTHLTLPTIA